MIHTSMKTTTKRIHLPSDNLWEWAEQSRRARHLTSGASSRPRSHSSKIARGILARLKEMLHAMSKSASKSASSWQ